MNKYIESCCESLIQIGHAILLILLLPVRLICDISLYAKNDISYICNFYLCFKILKRILAKQHAKIPNFHFLTCIASYRFKLDSTPKHFQYFQFLLFRKELKNRKLLAYRKKRKK